MEQTTKPLEHRLLGLRTTFFCKTIVCVTWKTAGEVLTYIAVGHFLRAVHQHLRTVIELRNAVHSKQQSQSLLQSQRVTAIAKKTVCIVILNESHHTRRVRIKVVITERIVKTIQTVPPGIGLFILGLVQLVKKREVHHRLEIGVLLSQLGIALPGCRVSGLRNPGLTNSVEIGIFRIELLHPLSHRIGIGIGIGVHTDTVNTNGLYPPDTVLNQITHQMGVMLVEVWHRGHKPTFGGLLQINL